MTFSNLFDSLGDLDWLAILVAAIAVFALGWLWYGPLFGRIWSQETGQEMGGQTPEVFTLFSGFAQFFIFSIGVAYFIPAVHVLFQNTSSFETLIVSSFVLAFFVIGMALLSRVVWEDGSQTRWLVDFGFWFLAAVVSSYVQDLMA